MSLQKQQASHCLSFLYRGYTEFTRSSCSKKGLVSETNSHGTCTCIGRTTTMYSESRLEIHTHVVGCSTIPVARHAPVDTVHTYRNCAIKLHHVMAN